VTLCFFRTSISCESHVAVALAVFARPVPGAAFLASNGFVAGFARETWIAEALVLLAHSLTVALVLIVTLIDLAILPVKPRHANTLAFGGIALQQKSVVAAGNIFVFGLRVSKKNKKRKKEMLYTSSEMLYSGRK